MLGKKLFCILITVNVVVSVFMAFTIAFAGTTTYQYDELDRLIKATYSDGTVIEYAYDEIGNRIQMAAYKPPVADFSATPVTGNFPLTVNFSDQTAGNATTWLWDFGDGFTSSEKNPSHIYDSQGTYIVSLTASNPYGTSSQTKTDYIIVQAGSSYTVKIVASGTTYTTLQAAYNAAVDGDVILCQAAELVENLTFDQNKSLTIAGGYNPEFTNNPGITTIRGTMAISAGALAAQNFRLK